MNKPGVYFGCLTPALMWNRGFRTKGQNQQWENVLFKIGIIRYGYGSVWNRVTQFHGLSSISNEILILLVFPISHTHTVLNTRTHTHTDTLKFESPVIFGRQVPYRVPFEKTHWDEDDRSPRRCTMTWGDGRWIPHMSYGQYSWLIIINRG